MSDSTPVHVADEAGNGSARQPARSLVGRFIRWVVLIAVSTAVFGLCFGIPPLSAAIVLFAGLVATVTFVMVDRPASAAVSAIAAVLVGVWLVPAWICFLVAALPIWAVGYVFSPDRNSRQERVIFATVISVVLVAILFNLVAAMAHGDSTIDCENNLKLLYTLIQQSAAANGRLPIDDQGRLTIENSTIQAAARYVVNACCDDEIAACYLCGRDVEPDDLGETPGRVRRILLYDRPGNHLRFLGNGMTEHVRWVQQEDALLLLTDGSVFRWRGDSPAYRRWADGYSQGIGEPFPPRMEERMRQSHWTSAH